MKKKVYKYEEENDDFIGTSLMYSVGKCFPTLKTLYGLLEIGSDIGVKLLLAGIRFTISGIVILVFYSVYNKALPPKLPKGLIRLEVVILGLFQTAMLYVMFYIGLYNSTGVKSSILSQGSIFLVVILSHFIYHNDKMHRGKAIGLLLGMLGIVIVNISGLTRSEGIFDFSLMGEGFLLMAGIFTTIGTFYTKRLTKIITPVLLTGWQMFSGGAMLTIAGLLSKKETLNLNTGPEFILLGYLIVISSGAFTLWFILLQKK